MIGPEKEKKQIESGSEKHKYRDNMIERVAGKESGSRETDRGEIEVE